MAEDYLTDDEQWEAVKRWIVENGLWVLAGIVLGVVGLFGYRYIDSARNDRDLRASVQFSEMTAALEHDDRNRTRRIADGLVRDYPSSPYADQAQLTLARLFVDDGQLPGAVAPLTEVMNSSKDSELRHIARLRLARVLTDQGKPDEAIRTLAEDAAPGAFTAQYHEVRGDAFYARKDFKSAVAEYKAALGGDATGVDSALLELKIADLGAPAAPAPATAMAPAPVPSNKAKP
jgi:predicted negative regulator of RcsB-dependent stress response